MNWSRNWTVMREAFPFHGVIMVWIWDIMYNCMILAFCCELMHRSLTDQNNLQQAGLMIHRRRCSLHWRHNGHDSVANHQSRDCLLNRLFRRISKKSSKFCITGLCAGNSPGTGEFPAQIASNAENVSIWWRHHVKRPDGPGSSCKLIKWHFRNSSVLIWNMTFQQRVRTFLWSSFCN